MCGIVGYIGERSRDKNTISKMLEQIIHRGPDGFSQYTSLNYFGGMRRLAINDLQSGNQPLFNKEKNVVVFYNGEIYNSPSLRKELQKKGYKFRTKSDGEVICHLFDEYKTDSFKYLEGMFAISLWDDDQKTLYLVRDSVGEKPLYYTYDSNYKELVFASEIKSISRLENIDLSLDHQSIWDFPTFLWIPEPNSIYKNIKALKKGEILTYKNGHISFRKYTNLKYSFKANSYSDNEIIERTRNIVEDSIKSRLLSDVPVGCFLSGGLDSSIVTAIASKEIESLSTFSIGFEDLNDFFHGKADESDEAKWYASKLKTKHTVIKATEASFYRLLDDFCKYGDQPFAVTSGLGILAIADEARKKGIKVLLSGDCADECFGGYSWYKYLDLPYSLSKSDYEKSVSMHNQDLDLINKLNVIESYNSQQRAWAWHYFAHENEKKGLFSQIFYEEKRTLNIFNHFNSNLRWDPETFIANDRDFYLTNEMLTKLDRMTMARSVEGRAPFASINVLSHANNLNYSQMVKDKTLKWSLRKAFSDILPEQVLNRSKHGFNVPIDHWLKSSWRHLVDETFSCDSYLYKNGFIDKKSKDFAIKLNDSNNKLNGHSLFAFIMLNKWLESFYGY